MNRYKVTIKGYDAPGTPAGPDVCSGIVEIIVHAPNVLAACGQYAHLGDIISVIKHLEIKNQFKNS
tara:strand:+ start:1698 stop:1895 length:198 start_codon:yes stop_codon:yes gene_type:complete